MQSAVGREEEAAAAPAWGGFIIYPSQMSLTFVTSSRARHEEQLIRSDRNSSSFPSASERDLTGVQLCSLPSHATPGGGMQKNRWLRAPNCPKLSPNRAVLGFCRCSWLHIPCGFPLPTDPATTRDLFSLDTAASWVSRMGSVVDKLPGQELTHTPNNAGFGFFFSEAKHP